VTVTDVVCLGILVTDVIARPVDELPHGALSLMDEVSLHGGGCALNTATGLGRFGLSVTVVGKVGADTFGDFVVGLLEQRGLDARGVLRDPTASTSATVVLVDQAGERSFLHLPGANGTLSASELEPAVVYAGRSLHIAGALVMPALDGAPTAALLAEAQRRSIHTSLDTVYDATGRWERVEPCLPHLDLLTMTLTEAQGVSGEREAANAADWLRQRGVEEVALTLGPAGSYVAGVGFEGHVAAFPVQAIDGTGAGDAFAAGMLYGRLAGWPLGDAALFANAAGALASTAVGATEGLLGLDETMDFAGLGAAA
jgi:sugar/nucleoside kinase (ribokinase family)